MRRDFEFWEALWKEESERDDAERGDRHECGTTKREVEEEQLVFEAIDKPENGF